MGDLRNLGPRIADSEADCYRLVTGPSRCDGIGDALRGAFTEMPPAGSDFDDMLQRLDGAKPRH